MRKVPLPNDDKFMGSGGILVIEACDYPLSTKAVEKAHRELKTGIVMWKSDSRGHRQMIVDFGLGPEMFENRVVLIGMIRHYNSIFRENSEKDNKWPPERAPE